jgi:hypothetical protein
MNRILDFNPDPEADVVDRVLVQLHKAIDENFPDTPSSSRKFTKTVFSEFAEETKIEKPSADNFDAVSQPSAKEQSFEKPITKKSPKRAGPTTRPTTDIAQLEYSKVERLDSHGLPIAAFKKLSMIGIIVIILAGATGIWIYQTLMP